jgi:hypothetical protein
MAAYDFSPVASLASHFRKPSVHWRMPTLPPISVPNATLAAYYRDPKVNWKMPTLPLPSLGDVQASR